MYDLTSDHAGLMSNHVPGESKKYTRLMSHKNDHCINLKNFTGFDSKILKLVHDKKNNHF